jgi:hypothetical protein
MKHPSLITNLDINVHLHCHLQLYCAVEKWRYDELC